MSHEWYKWLLFVGFAAIVSGCKVHSDELDQWRSFIRSIKVSENEILCEREYRGDRFLVATANGRLITAYRVDVTGVDGNAGPFVISWQFADQEGSSLDSTTPPKSIVKRIVESKGRIYAEVAGSRGLRLENAKIVNVSMDVQKYDKAPVLPPSGRVDFKKLHNIELCKVLRSKFP